MGGDGLNELQRDYGFVVCVDDRWYYYLQIRKRSNRWLERLSRCG